MTRIVHGMVLVIGMLLSNASNVGAVAIETFYGIMDIQEPVLLDLINSQAIQRLKKINQYGISYVVDPLPYTRYQHSLGVLFLLRHFNASLEEQIFGLLHDVSHTAFSHVADYLFNSILDADSYQDTILEWFIEKTDVMSILRVHGFEDVCTLQKRATFKMLKNNLPNLCIDRLEYTLYGAYIEHWLTKEEIHTVIEHVSYVDQQFVFDDPLVARAFADASITLSCAMICAPHHCFIYEQMALILKRSFEINLLSMDDLLFSTDNVLWNLVMASNDALIQTYRNRIINYTHSFQVAQDSCNCDFSIKPRYKGIDPLVKIGNKICTLTKYDHDFKRVYEKARHQCSQPINFVYV